MGGLLLQNGKQSFTDFNGRPLLGGKVYFFEVGTNTPKDTFQDPAQTVLNTNPVLLDARGEARIYGTGAYRQVLRDFFGVLIWDQVLPDVQKNVASNITITAPDGSTQTLQDLAGPNGAKIVGRGTSTVDKDLSSVESFNVTPEMFGAKGDGTTVDNKAINDAIDFASTRGASVKFTKGKTYIVDGNLNPVYTDITGNRNGGIILKDNTALFLNGATVKMKTSTQIGYSVFNWTNTKGAWVYGPGNVIGDLDTHVANPGPSGDEYGYGFFFVNCSGFGIENVTVSKCWGDGIFIGNSTPTNNATAPFNGLFNSVICDKNRRQGCSLVGSSDIDFNYCDFNNTAGAAPACGVDLEADSPGQFNRRINFNFCKGVGNAGLGFAFSGPTNANQQITMTGCYTSGNSNGGIRSEFGSLASAKLVSCRIEGGLSGGQNMKLYGCDIYKADGAVTAQALSLDVDSGFEMFGGTVQSFGAGNTPLFIAGATSRQLGTGFYGVKFTMINGPTGVGYNVNGFNLFAHCGFYLGGTNPTGNFGFDVLKFDDGAAQIDTCYFDPLYHSLSGTDFKGSFTMKPLRGGSSVMPYWGTWTRGDFVFNSSPVELGVSPMKYTVLGWTCMVSGSPGTMVWKECRTLTGS